MTRPPSAPADAAGDRGDSLVEVIMTVLTIGVAVTALVAGLATAANASRAQREAASVDAVLRNYAEATKGAGHMCTPGRQYEVAYVPPEGFTVAVTPTDRACTAAHATQVVTLTVQGPSGVQDSMQIVLRTP